MTIKTGAISEKFSYILKDQENLGKAIEILKECRADG